MFQAFQQHWEKTFPQLSTGNCRLLLAVSGGVDSVVLADLVARSGFDFRIAHCNFQLRGGESERDEQFVRALGVQYGKEVLVQRFDTAAYASEKKISIQEAARELRYDWFHSIAEQQQEPCLIVTAHHADDTIETVLMHLFRGTGIRGLTGIRPIQPDRKLLRPLLPFRKQELMNYATEKGLSFVEDASNSSDKYTRNFFRNRVIPAVSAVFPQAEESILHTIAHLDEAAILYDQAVQAQLAKLIEYKGTELHVPVLKWKKATPLTTITWELIRPYGFSAAQTGEVIKLLDASHGSYLSSPTHRLIRNRNWIILAPHASEAAAHIIIDTPDQSIPFGNYTLQLAQITTTNPKPQTLNHIACLDASKIHFPLILRKWKAGDYFYPLGMQKKKKLNRFLIDLKLSATEKEQVWVLETDKKILWVLGYRIDDRFKLTDKTSRVLQLTCQDNSALH